MISGEPPGRTGRDCLLPQQEGLIVAQCPDPVRTSPVAYTEWREHLSYEPQSKLALGPDVPLDEGFDG